MPIPSRCCCVDESHCCFEVCKKFPRQIEITITGPTDVECWCYSDEDDGTAMANCTDDCNDVRIACLAAIDYGQSPEDQCSDKYLCESAYKSCTQACIGSHIDRHKCCPSGVLAGTFILDLVEDESGCGSNTCTWSVRIPTGDWSQYGGLFYGNCNEPLNAVEDTYYELIATLTDYDWEDGVTNLEVVCPWGPTFSPMSWYYNDSIPDEDFCDGESFTLTTDSVLYADVVAYRSWTEGGFFPFDCGNPSYSWEAGGYDYQCVFTDPVTEWPDLFPVDYPGDYSANPHDAILISDANTVGGQFD